MTRRSHIGTCLVWKKILVVTGRKILIKLYFECFFTIYFYSKHKTPVAIGKMVEFFKIVLQVLVWVPMAAESVLT